jgi:hypothetical protein
VLSSDKLENRTVSDYHQPYPRKLDFILFYVCSLYIIVGWIDIICNKYNSMRVMHDIKIVSSKYFKIVEEKYLVGGVASVVRFQDCD